MIRGPILIDTNVFVLYVTGAAGRSIVPVHKRCNQFTEEDYDALIALLGDEPELILLPNVVAEASNLLAQIAEPYKAAVLRMLKAAVLTFSEEYVTSRMAVSHVDYMRLRLTDCALLSAPDPKFHLLTVDFNLYLAFLRDDRPVTNFRHVIDNRP